MKFFLNKIKSKLLVLLFLTMGIIYISGSIFLIVESRTTMLNNLEKQGVQMAELLSKTSLSYMKRYFYIKILEDAVKVEEFPEVAYCEIYDENHKSVTQIKYINRGQYVNKRDVIKNKDIMVVSSIIEDEAGVYGQVEIGLYKSHIKKSVHRRIFMLLSLFFVIMFISGIFINMFLSKIFLNPILELSDVMTKLSKGEFALSTLEKRDDEIGELAKHFNNMSLHLKDSFHKIDSENKNLLKAFNFKKHILEISEEKVLERTKELKKALEQMEISKVEAEKANAEAIDANRAKTEFIANISHEIRTPLNVIIGFSDLLGSLTENDIQKKYLESIKTSSKGLLALINDILDLSKLEVDKMELQYENLDIAKLFDDIETMFKYKILEKDIAFEKNISKNIPEFIFFDELRLRQIMFNLMGNSIKFTEEGYIKMSVKFNYQNDDKGELLITIEDTGIGIAENDKDKIFKSFRQQHGQNTRKYGGTGLGLAISKKLIDMMNGEIDLKSELGKGTIFSIKFKDVQIDKTLSLKDKKIKSNYDDIIFEESTILIIDDLEINRNIITSNLAKTNLNLIEAADGEEGLKLIKEYLPDLVFLDIRMPGYSGYDIMKLLDEDLYLRDIPVIAISAEEKKENLEKIFSEFILKPVRRKDIFETLMKYIPYTKKEDGALDTFFNYKIEREAFPKLRELIERLEGELMLRWKSYQETQPVNEVKDFANDIKNIGIIYKVSMLEDYGKYLLESVENYDIELMRKMLKTYTSLIERLKKAV